MHTDDKLGVIIKDPKGGIYTELKTALDEGRKVEVVAGRKVDSQALRDMILRLRKKKVVDTP